MPPPEAGVAWTGREGKRLFSLLFIVGKDKRVGCLHGCLDNIFIFVSKSCLGNMKTSIELNEMRFFAYHGVGSQERRVGNDYVVSLRVACPIEGAMESDALEDTLDYAALYALVAAEMATPSLLLEHVAGRIITAIGQRFPQITGGKLIVTKEKPPIPGDVRDVSVVVEW